MGMRSTIAYTDKSGVTKVTSVQWSTRLDYNMSLDFASRKPDAADNARRVGEMFRDITNNYEHISSLDRVSAEERREGDVLLASDSEFTAVGAQPRGGEYGAAPGEYTRGPGLSDERRDNFITGYHLDDGIGASYDERSPGKLTYFYRDDATGNVVMEEATMGQIRAGTTTNGYHTPEQDASFKKALSQEKVKARRAEVEKMDKTKDAEAANSDSSGGGSAPTSSSSPGGGGSSTGSAGSAHVNPRTGKTGICRAIKDPCPFGGESGKENHYDTEAEARAAYEKAQGGSGLGGLKKK